MLKLSGAPVTVPDDLRLTDVASVKLYGHIATTEHDTLLQALIDRACRSVYRTLGERVIPQKAGTPFVYILNGYRSNELWLPQWPIVAVNSIEYGYITDSANTWATWNQYTTADYHFDADNGVLIKNSGVWPSGQLKVSWDAGYAAGAIPLDLVEVVESWVNVKFQRGLTQRWDKTSEGLESQAHSWTLSELPKTHQDILNSYKRWELGIG